MSTKYFAIVIAFIASVANPLLLNGEDPHALKINFEGNEVISSKNLRRELEGTRDYLMNTYGGASLGELKSVVEDLVIAGYHSSGFPEATVQATVQQSDESEYLNVSIQEGRRYRNATICVIGANPELTDLIIDRFNHGIPQGDVHPTFITFNGALETKWKKDDGKDARIKQAVWEPNGYTDFQRAARINAFAQEVVESVGLYDCDVTATISLDDDSQTAELHVDIQNATERHANRIQISGLYDAQEEDILDFVHLKPGDSIDAGRICNMTLLLWSSGRFKRHSIHWHHEKSDTLCFDLELVPGVPWVTAPLDDNAETLLKFVKWFSETSQRGEDFCFSDKRVTAIVSPTSVYIVGALNQSLEEGQLTECQFKAILDKGGIVFDHSECPESFVLPPLRGKLSLSASIVVIPPQSFFLPGDEAGPHLFQTYENFHFTFEEEESSPVDFTIEISPSDFLSLAYRKDLKISSDENTLSISGLGMNFALEKATGKLLKFEKDSGGTLSIGKGLYANAKSQMSNKPNSFDISRPLESTVAAITQPQWWQTLQSYLPNWPNSSLRTAIPKLAKSEVCTVLNEVLQMQFESRQGFVIPYEKNESKDSLNFWIASLVQDACSRLPNDCWPMQVATVQMMLLKGMYFDANTIVESIQNDPQNGPICLALLSYSLQQNQESRTNGVAREGVKRMQAENIDRDLRMIRDIAPEHTIDDFYAIIKSLSDDELNALCEWIPVKFLREYLLMVHRTSPSLVVEESSTFFVSVDGALRDQLDRLSVTPIVSEISKMQAKNDEAKKTDKDSKDSKDSKDTKNFKETKGESKSNVIYAKLPWEE